MRNVLLFTTSFKNQECLPVVKKEVKNYLGTRMIEDENIGDPVLTCNTKIETKDLKAIDEIVQKYDDVVVLSIIDDKSIKMIDFDRIGTFKPYAETTEEI